MPNRLSGLGLARRARSLNQRFGAAAEDHALLEGILLVVLFSTVGLLFLSFLLGEVLGDLVDVFNLGDGSGSPMLGRVLLIFVILFAAAMFVASDQGLDWWWALIIGFGFGLAGGLPVYWLLRGRKRQEGSSHLHISDAKGEIARVSIGIDAGRVGQVTLSLNGENAQYSAQSTSGAGIPTGTVVTVVDVQGSVLTVEPSEVRSAQRERVEEN